MCERGHGLASLREAERRDADIHFSISGMQVLERATLARQ